MNPTVLRHSLLAAALVFAFAATPSLAASTYCAPSGDFCTSVAKADGVRLIEMRTFSLRGRVRVCVGAEWGFDCKPFRLRRQTEDPGLWSFSIRWRRHFSDQGRGSYRVSFDKSGEQIGPTLSFRR
jgi:hypothetical protein